ncbi:unnamed protein product [Amoebophrya sp. A120]|nr:unnamed protein product [Amoebophrya sp. A120]|eukprot:GSA120T00023238001.1
MSNEASKVFVGGLPLQATKEELQSYAAEFGEVKDAVIMLDRLTKNSRGFGFVTFVEVEAAQRCLGKTEPHMLAGKQIEIKPTESDKDENPEWKLFIGGLEESVKDEDLRSKFSEFGEVNSAVVMMRDGVSRKFGFVSYKTEPEFAAAIICPHVEINGKKIDVKVAQMPRGQHFPTEGKLYIGDLGESMTNDMLKEYFSSLGEVLSATVMMDHGTQKSKGFGFVQFSEPKQAYDVMRKPHMINGTQVVVKSSANNAPVGKQGKGKDGKDGKGGYGKGGYGGYYPPGQGKGGHQDCTNKIFVGGLPPSANNETMNQFFSQYGPVKDCIAMYDRETTKPRGFGYVTFASEQAMYACLQDKERHYIDGKYIDCKRATNQHDRSGGGYGAAQYGQAAMGAYGAAYGYGATPAAYGYAAPAYPAYDMTAMDPNYAAGIYNVLDPTGQQAAATAAAYQQYYAAAAAAPQAQYAQYYAAAADPNAAAYAQQYAAQAAARPGPY